MNITLGPEDTKKLMNALRETSNSMTFVEAQRSLQKEIRNDICDALNLNKKVFTKLARTYHKQNFSEEVELHQEYEKIYEVIQTKGP